MRKLAGFESETSFSVAKELVKEIAFPSIEAERT